MRVSVARIRDACGAHGISLSGALKRAGVSRNAFYSLARRESVLPRSLRALGAALGVRPGDLLTEDDPRTEAMRRLLAEADGIARRHPRVDRDNVRHTLLSLRRKPLDRLKTALGRAP